MKTDKRGHIVVDEFQNTTRPGVYAVGDVCGKALLTPGNYASFPGSYERNCTKIGLPISHV